MKSRIDDMNIIFDWWQAARRYTVATTGVALALAALTAWVIFFYPREYHSVAKLLIRVGHESATVDPTADASGQRIQMQLSKEHDVLTELDVMRSRLLLQSVLDEVGTDVVLSGVPPGEDSPSSNGFGLLSALKGTISFLDPISDSERAMRELENNLAFSRVRESSLVVVEYRAKTPQVAQSVAAAWVQAYLAKQNEFHQTSGSFEFLEAKEQEIRSLLEEEYVKLRETKNSSKIVTIAGQQSLLERQLAIVREALTEVDSELQASRSRISSLNNLLSNLNDRMLTDEVSGKTNEAHDSMRSRLYDLEVLEKEYNAKYSPRHPKLVQIREQLAEARQILDAYKGERQETTSGVNPIRLRMDQELLLESANLESLTSKRETLDKKRVDLLAEAAELNAVEVEIASVQQQIDILETRYSTHCDRLEQARINDSLSEKQINSVNVIQPASFVEQPVTPRKMIVAILGIFAIGLSSFGVPHFLAAIAEHRQHADNTRPEFEGTESDAELKIRNGLLTEDDSGAAEVSPRVLSNSIT